MICTRFRKALYAVVLILALVVALHPVGRPTQADSFEVTNTNDSGAYSLRQAILDANASPGADTITFSITTCMGVCVIQPLSALPTLTGGEITIDGYTQPGAVEATATTSATILIEIDGTNAGAAHGLYITSAANEVRGLSIVSFQQDGVRIDGNQATGNVVSGNHIGTGADGTSDGGNGGAGAYLTGGTQNNTIGGDAPAERNVISNNDGYGVVLGGIDTMDNTVSGNYIGTDANGAAPLANALGIAVQLGAQDNTIGGDTPGERNVVSGNDGRGVIIYTSGTTGNTVSGNFIGTDASGTNPLPNTGYGLSIIDGAQYNTIGGDAPGEGNVISANGNTGVEIKNTGTMSNTVAGNYIGTDATGTQDLGNGQNGVYVYSGAQYNTIGGDAPGERNVISGNDQYGIGLSGSGTSHNTVSGDYIGTDASGTLSLANPVGIVVSGGAHHNTIGGDAPGERNVISGNAEHGVLIYSGSTTDNTVSGNFIGTDASGATPLPNSKFGVMISIGAHDNTIGGSAPGEGNVISANGEDGVNISRTGTMSNTVAGNYIGTDATGTLDLGNAEYGVNIHFGAENNTIGEGNVISGNGKYGVRINASSGPTAGNTVLGNYIGTGATGLEVLGNGLGGVTVGYGATTNTIGPGNVIAHHPYDGVVADRSETMGNVITQNRIFDNDSGIALYSGAHGGIEPPVVASVTPGSIEVTGTACVSCTVELFGNGDDDGEGELYVASTPADASGHFTVTLSSDPGTSFLTATATDPISGTSEFSAPYEIELSRVLLPVVLRAP